MLWTCGGRQCYSLNQTRQYSILTRSTDKWFMELGFYRQKLAQNPLVGPNLEIQLAQNHSTTSSAKKKSFNVIMINLILLSFNLEKFYVIGVKLYSGAHLLKSVSFKINSLILHWYLQIETLGLIHRWKRMIMNMCKIVLIIFSSNNQSNNRKCINWHEIWGYPLYLDGSYFVWFRFQLMARIVEFPSLWWIDRSLCGALGGGSLSTEAAL